MAVGQRSLKELQDLCSSLGIDVVCPRAKNGKIKYNKRYYVEALQKYYLHKEYGDNLPKHLQLMLSIDTVMCADRLHAKKEDMQKAIKDSEDWGYQEKMNGVRMPIVYVRGEGLHFYSRGISVTNYLPVEYTSKVWLGEGVKEIIEASIPEQIDSFIIDHEVISTNPKISTVMAQRGVVTETMLQAVTALLALNAEDSIRIQREMETPLKFCNFDCFYYNGEWLIEGKKEVVQEDREKVSRFIVNILAGLGMKISSLPTVYGKDEKIAFLKSIMDSGGEGVIAKHRKGLYRAVEARSRNLWVKIKRSVAQSLTSTPYNDTIDAFVSGYGLGEEGKGYENLVAYLCFSVYLIKEDGSRVEHEIARISHIPLEYRKRITEVGEDGIPRMVDWMYGRVAEIDGQSVTSRAMRLQHARFGEGAWREDKNPDSCELHESFLKEMIL